MRKRRSPCARNCPPCSAIGGRCNRTTHPVVGNCSVCLARVGFIHKGQSKQARALLRNSIQRGLPVIRVEGNRLHLSGKNGRPAAVTARAYRAGHHQRAPEQQGPAVALVAKPRALARRAGSRCHLRSGRALRPFLNGEMGVQSTLFKPAHPGSPSWVCRGVWK